MEATAPTTAGKSSLAAFITAATMVDTISMGAASGAAVIRAGVMEGGIMEVGIAADMAAGTDISV